MKREEKERIKKYLNQQIRVLYIEHGYLKTRIGLLQKITRDFILVNGKEIAFQDFWRMLYKIILLSTQEVIFENTKVDFEYGALPKGLIRRIREIEQEKREEKKKINKIPLDKFLGV